MKKKTSKQKVNFVRYADDFIVTGESAELLKNGVKPIIVKFLAERGLELSEEKTLITHINEPLDQSMKKDSGKQRAKKNIFLMNKGTRFQGKTENLRQGRQNLLTGTTRVMQRNGERVLPLFVINIQRKITLKKEQTIALLKDNARNKVAREVNNILIQTYWEIGRIIVEDEQGNSDRAEYGKQLVTDLSKRLTKEYGKGFSRSNLQNMRNFYLSYPICQTLSGKLSWSHYCELLSISDEKKRSFYEKETINANWSVRELKRQIKTSLFERLLLSSGDENKEKVLELALKGNEINKASDVVKDPYVFEFLGIPEEKAVMESDLEKALITHIEKFLLELGKRNCKSCI